MFVCISVMFRRYVFVSDVPMIQNIKCIAHCHVMLIIHKMKENFGMDVDTLYTQKLVMMRP